MIRGRENHRIKGGVSAQSCQTVIVPRPRFEVLEAGCLAGWLVGWLAGWAGWLAGLFPRSSKLWFYWFSLRFINIYWFYFGAIGFDNGS